MIDQVISDDLSIVARTSRARPIALETTLAKLTAEKPVTTVPFDVAHAYARCVARVSAGLAAMASIATLLVYVRWMHGDEADLLDGIAHMPKFWVAVCVLGVASLAHVVGMHVALKAKQPNPARIANLAIAVTIGGTATVCLFFGTTLGLLGSESLVSLQAGREFGLVIGPLVAVTVATGVIARTGMPERRWMLVAGAGLLVATVSTGLRLGVHPPQTAVPPASTMLLVGLTICGTVALMLVISDLAARSQRRQSTVSLAQLVTARRFARTCAGTVVLGVVVVVLALAYREDGRWHPWMPDAEVFSIARFWVGVICVSLAMLTYIVALRLGRSRRFAVRRFAWSSTVMLTAGAVTGCLLFAVWYVAGGDDLRMFFLWEGAPAEVFAFVHGNWLLLVIAVPVSVAAALLVARRTKPIPWCGAIGLALVTGAIVVGSQLGAGATQIETEPLALSGPVPTFALRAALMAIGGAGLVLIVSRFVLRARAREDALLDQYSS